jgi:hypothetical protein
MEMLQSLWIATIKEIKLKKKKKKRKRFVVECEVIEIVVCCQDKAVFRVRQDCPPRLSVPVRDRSTKFRRKDFLPLLCDVLFLFLFLFSISCA